MASKWLPEHYELFLNLYQGHPCLWDNRIHSYNNRHARRAAIQAIQRDLNMEGLTEIDIKLKIKSIRSSYSAELKKIRLSMLQGCGGDDIYVPSLSWFNQAHKFLNPVSYARDHFIIHNIPSGDSCSAQMSDVHRSGRARTQSVNSSTDSRDIIFLREQDYAVHKSMSPEHSQFETPENAGPLEPKVYWDSNVKEAEPTAAASVTDGTFLVIDGAMLSIQEDDEFDIIGKNVATKLRNLDPTQKIFAEKLINDALYEAQLNNLDHSSQVKT